MEEQIEKPKGDYFLLVERSGRQVLNRDPKADHGMVERRKGESLIEEVEGRSLYGGTQGGKFK